MVVADVEELVVCQATIETGPNADFPVVETIRREREGRDRETENVSAHLSTTKDFY